MLRRATAARAPAAAGRGPAAAAAAAAAGPALRRTRAAASFGASAPSSAPPEAAAACRLRRTPAAPRRGAAGPLRSAGGGVVAFIREDAFHARHLLSTARQFAELWYRCACPRAPCACAPPPPFRRLPAAADLASEICARPP